MNKKSNEMVYFNAEVADQLIQSFIKETRKTVPGYFQPDFFNKIHRGHSGDKWWQDARKKQKAQLKDLQWICKKLQVDIELLEISKEPRGEYYKKAPVKQDNYQLEIDLKQIAPDNICNMSDHEIIDKLGYKRIKEIYLLSLYKKEKDCQ